MPLYLGYLFVFFNLFHLFLSLWNDIIYEWIIVIIYNILLINECNDKILITKK